MLTEEASLRQTHPEVQIQGVQAETSHGPLEEARLPFGPATGTLPPRGQQKPGKQNQFGSEIHHVTTGNPPDQRVHCYDSQCGNIERYDSEAGRAELDRIPDSPVAPYQGRHKPQQRNGSYPQQANGRGHGETFGEPGKSGQASTRADKWVVKANPWRREQQIVNAGDGIRKTEGAASLVLHAVGQLVAIADFEGILKPGVVVRCQQDPAKDNRTHECEQPDFVRAAFP